MQLKFNSFHLKLFAVLFMIIDHMAYYMISPDIPIYAIMRMVGRLAAPIFWFCFVEGYKRTKNKTKYNQVKEYGELVGINIENYGYYFTYNMPRKKYQDALALVESKLDVNDALILGKMKKIEYKIGFLKQNRKTSV